MALIGGESLYRLTDYLDRQAVREKEKRTEKFLTVLPTYLQKQISGITDEKTLFSTIPKLSAQMYAFGPQVGQAANQILGNLADVKYKEIAIGKEEKQRQATLDATKEIFSGSGVDITGMLDKMNKGEVPASTAAGLLESYVNTHRTTDKGVGYRSNGEDYFRSYITDAYGNIKKEQTLRFQREKDGSYTGDDVSTDIAEHLSLTPQQFEYMAKDLEAQKDIERRLKSSLTLQAGQIAIADAKAKEKLLRDTKAEVYKERGKQGIVYADIDEKTGRKYFYREVKEPMLSNAPGVTAYKTKREIVDPSNIEDIGQGFEQGIKSSDVNLLEGEYYRQLNTLADKLRSKGVEVKGNIKFDDADRYNSIALIEKTAENTDDPEVQALLREYKAQKEAYDYVSKEFTKKLYPGQNSQTEIPSRYKK